MLSQNKHHSPNIIKSKEVISVSVIQKILISQLKQLSNKRPPQVSDSHPPLMVVKSSRLPAKIATYLVRISWLLCLAFLYRWRFLNKISPDWPLTLTTQPSTSKLSDNRAGPLHKYVPHLRHKKFFTYSLICFLSDGNQFIVASYRCMPSFCIKKANLIKQGIFWL